jgi:hypothetical protein
LFAWEDDDDEEEEEKEEEEEEEKHKELAFRKSKLASVTQQMYCKFSASLYF